jgi:predicted transcriptional regulator
LSFRSARSHIKDLIKYKYLKIVDENGVKIYETTPKGLKLIDDWDEFSANHGDII